jgi:hypothetical protein
MTIFRLLEMSAWLQKENMLQKQVQIRSSILCMSLPPKKKLMKGKEECEMLEKVLAAFQVQVLKRTADAGSNPEQA